MESYNCVSNHWPHKGTWGHMGAHGDTWVYNKQPISEFINMHQNIGHIGAHGHIYTHEGTIYDDY